MLYKSYIEERRVEVMGREDVVVEAGIRQPKRAYDDWSVGRSTTLLPAY